MPAKLIKGDKVADRLREEMAAELKDIYAETGQFPGLAVIVVGEDSASLSYVTNIESKSNALGFNVMIHRLSVDVSEGELLQLIEELNYNDNVHGIMIQLPLPEHINLHVVQEALDREKDVDVVHDVLIAATGKPGLVKEDWIKPGAMAIAMLLDNLIKAARSS